MYLDTNVKTHATLTLSRTPTLSRRYEAVFHLSLASLVVPTSIEVSADYV